MAVNSHEKITSKLRLIFLLKVEMKVARGREMGSARRTLRDILGEVRH